MLLLICGSLRAGSVNAAVLRTAAADATATTTYAGLGALPHFDPDADRDPLPAPVRELRAAIEAADALLFCVPEYAGALPGSVKNLLDWTVGGTETVDKPAGWINASERGAAGAHAELATVLRYTGALVDERWGAHIPIPRAAVGADGYVTDALLAARIVEHARRLSRVS